MNLYDFVQSGGTSVWHFAPRGASASHIWAVENLFTVNKFFSDMVHRIWVGAGIILAAMFFAEMARVYLGGVLEKEWKTSVFRLLLAATLIAGYDQVAMLPAQVADAVMANMADDASCNEALFTLMVTAEKGMLATFNPSGAAGVALENQSDQGFLQGMAYTAFFLVWWVMPMVIAGIVMGFYLLGPYCLAFFVFKPMAGVAGMWAKMFCGMFLAYVMLCIAFFLLLASQVTLATATTNSVSDPYSTIAFSVAGLLVACSMPSFAVRILGGRMSFIPGKS